MDAKTITLKAMVDKERNRVIYVESDADFVNILFSFLTMPLGTIIRLTRNHPPVTELGCLSNLYASVENLDAKFLRTEACKTMLLYPQNVATDHCKNQKLRIDDNGSAPKYFTCWCGDRNDRYPRCSQLSNYKNASCSCGRSMDNEQLVYGSEVSPLGFVYDVTRFLITDELEVQPTSSSFIISLLSKHGVEDSSALEEMSFEIGSNEVLNLLKFSLLSRFALTDTLLQHTSTREASTQDFVKARSVKREALEEAPDQNGKISVRLFISKSKKTVCYAEGDQDFADLLFSFLTVPLGHVSKQMLGTCSSGCFRSLYKSVQNLDAEKTMVSAAKKDILLSPKLPNWYSFPGQLLGLEEVGDEILEYFWGHCYKYKRYLLASDKSILAPKLPISRMYLIDPKSPRAESSSSGEGFLRKGGMFTVTDDLIVTPISSGLSILKNLKVSFSDIEERVVFVGKEEAWGLLVAAINGGRSILTQVFLPEGRLN